VLRAWRRRPAVARLRRRRPGVRRLLAAGLAAAAASVALRMVAPEPPHGVVVVVAAHDLAAGRQLTAGDLRRSVWAPGTAPGLVVTDPARALGRSLAGPLTAGSPITAAGLLGPGLLAGQEPGRLAVVVPLTQPGLVGLVEAGDHVDVVSAATGTGAATDAVVLAERAASGGGWAGFGDAAEAGTVTGELVLGVDAAEAGALARAEAAGPLGIAVHSR
jgi:pilus assembly protein CpaB